MSGAINQLQLIYNAEEDRILFRVNSTDRQEYRFWITRRYALLLLQILQKHRDADPDVSSQTSPEAKQALQSFKQEQAINQADFTRKFEEKPSQLPLGDDAKLAFKINYRITDGILHLGVQPKEGQGITIGVNQDLNVSLSQLLLAAAKKGEWRIAGSNLSVAPQQERVIN